MEDMLAERVMQCSRADNPELWDAGSPLSHVRADAPPMFVIQGTHDSLVWVEEAQRLCLCPAGGVKATGRLRGVARRPACL